MKISSYYKNKGKKVILKTDYEDLKEYEKVFISKVFTQTKVDEKVLVLPNVSYGGTGFFYDKAPDLDYIIEHSYPDYELYNNFLITKLNEKSTKNSYKYYLNYSIGFMTRGCFRQCSFCVNRKYTNCLLHSPINEFLNKNMSKICLLDDNILANPEYANIFESMMVKLFLLLTILRTIN